MNLFLTDEIMYEALLNKDAEFEGQFFAGVKTTGIFCRPTCTARKPKKENVAFFESVKIAMASGFRPCKVCKPLEKTGEMTNEIKFLLQEIESNPSIKITDYGLVKKGIEPSKIRRWFLKNYGLTFQAYQRLTRINHAFNDLKNGESVSTAAFENGYESLSGFNHSFKKATEISPGNYKETALVTYMRLSSPIGQLLAASTEDGICLLEFTDRRMLETELNYLRKHFHTSILPGTNSHLEKLKTQLEEYFNGSRKNFNIPLVTPGSEFQNRVWKLLQTIPYAKTKSYKHQAIDLGNIKAIRAVANVNGQNRIAIVIPCHRVVGEDGSLTGYGGGLWRKQWLLKHEKENT